MASLASDSATDQRPTSLLSISVFGKSAAALLRAASSSATRFSSCATRVARSASLGGSAATGAARIIASKPTRVKPPVFMRHHGGLDSVVKVRVSEAYSADWPVANRRRNPAKMSQNDGGRGRHSDDHGPPETMRHSLCGSYRSASYEHNDAADHGCDSHDRMQDDGVRLVHIDLERTRVHDALRCVIRDALEHEG